MEIANFFLDVIVPCLDRRCMVFVPRFSFVIPASLTTLLLVPSFKIVKITVGSMVCSQFSPALAACEHTFEVGISRN